MIEYIVESKDEITFGLRRTFTSFKSAFGFLKQMELAEGKQPRLITRRLK